MLSWLVLNPSTLHFGSKSGPYDLTALAIMLILAVQELLSRPPFHTLEPCPPPRLRNGMDVRVLYILIILE